jgi:hypothetical protein
MFAVAAALLATLAIWLLAELAFGIPLRAPVYDGSGQTLDINALDVAFVTVALSLAGWGVMALLERLTVRARLAWLLVAPTVLVLSLGTPLAGTGVTIADRMVLELMHLAAGAVLIPALYRTSPSRLPVALAGRQRLQSAKQPPVGSSPALTDHFPPVLESLLVEANSIWHDGMASPEWPAPGRPE